MSVQGVWCSCTLAAFTMALYMAYRWGRKAAQLDAVKALQRKQEKEDQRAQEIMDHVAVMDEHTVRQRLRHFCPHKR